VIVWIVTRDPDTVEHMASHWPVKHGAGRERRLLTTFETALEEMAHSAETGRITASGCRWDGEKAASRQPISSSQWSHDAVLTADSILTPHPGLRTFSGRKMDWVMVWFDRPSVLRTWPAARTKDKRGAKPGWDWDDIKQFVFQELDNSGDFDDPLDATKGWQSFSDLYSRIIYYIEKRKGDGTGPAISTLKDHVPDMVTKWRAQRAQSQT
jgi:hypothetical protein